MKLTIGMSTFEGTEEEILSIHKKMNEQPKAAWSSTAYPLNLANRQLLEVTSTIGNCKY